MRYDAHAQPDFLKFPRNSPKVSFILGKPRMTHDPRSPQIYARSIPVAIPTLYQVATESRGEVDVGQFAPRRPHQATQLPNKGAHSAAADCRSRRVEPVHPAAPPATILAASAACLEAVGQAPRRQRQTGAQSIGPRPQCCPRWRPVVDVLDVRLPANRKLIKKNRIVKPTTSAPKAKRNTSRSPPPKRDTKAS